MSIFIRAMAAPKPTSRVAFYATQVAAAALTVTALAQLFTFDGFPSVLSVYLLPGGYPTAAVLAAVLVTAEVFAVSVFLMMRLSHLMRLFSLVCGFVTCVIWLVLGVQLLSQGDTIVNNGLFGATFATHTGWLPIVFAACVAIGLIVMVPVSLPRAYKRR